MNHNNHNHFLRDILWVSSWSFFTALFTQFFDVMAMARKVPTHDLVTSDLCDPNLWKREAFNNVGFIFFGKKHPGDWIYLRCLVLSNQIAVS